MCVQSSRVEAQTASNIFLLFALFVLKRENISNRTISGKQLWLTTCTQKPSVYEGQLGMSCSQSPPETKADHFTVRLMKSCSSRVQE